MKLSDVITELKRRRVFRVTGIYAIVAWLVVQVAATLPGNTGFGARGHAYALYRAGRAAEAIAALEAVPQRAPWTTGTLLHIYAATGRPADARRMLAELERQAQHRYVPAHAHAMVHVALGEYDAALDELERGWGQGSVPPELNVIPEFEPIRSHPRFRELLRKLGLETGRGELMKEARTS